jgi:predicted nucleotidyltransferase
MLQIKSSGSVTIKSVQYNALLAILGTVSQKIKNTYPAVNKIVLFGSFAKGNYTPESDVDIVIVVKQINEPFLQRSDSFLDLFTEIPFDINLMVYTEEEIDKMFADGNSFIKNILAEAMEL